LQEGRFRSLKIHGQECCFSDVLCNSRITVSVVVVVVVVVAAAAVFSSLLSSLSSSSLLYGLFLTTKVHRDNNANSIQETHQEMR